VQNELGLELPAFFPYGGLLKNENARYIMAMFVCTCFLKTSQNVLIKFISIYCNRPISVAARSKAYVCSTHPLGLGVRILPRSVNVCMLLMLIVVMSRSVWRADPSSRGVLLRVCVCVSECEQVKQ
jgi:hypothetical protein